MTIKMCISTSPIPEAAALPKPKVLLNPFSYKRRKLEWNAQRAVPLFCELL